MRNISLFVFFVIFLNHYVVSELRDIENLALANNEFALKLYNSLDSDENVFISPASIYTALGMLYRGARTTTAEEIRETLQYDLSGLNDHEIHHTFRQLLDLIENAPDEYQLEVANAIVAHVDFNISPKYKQDLQTYYKAVVKRVDVIRDNIRALQEINGWVNEKTHGKITKLLDQLDRSTRLILLNAVYFKGTWKKEFDPERTLRGQFYNRGTHPVITHMMNSESKFLYGHFPERGFDALELPYKGEDISMVILLPTSNTGLPSVEQNLDVSQLEEVFSGLSNVTVITTIPKFKVEYSTSLKNTLNDLGMRETFSSSADLSGISQERLRVSDVIHKSYIEVNEEGSEAAAVTAIKIVGVSIMIPPTPVFHANHPFLYLIRDRRTNMILFMGRVHKL